MTSVIYMNFSSAAEYSTAQDLSFLNTLIIQSLTGNEFSRPKLF